MPGRRLIRIGMKLWWCLLSYNLRLFFAYPLGQLVDGVVAIIGVDVVHKHMVIIK